MRRVLSWAVLCVGGIGLLAVGALVGMALKYPLGWELSDLNASVAGAAIGAVASVAGAYVLLRLQLANEHRSAEESRDQAIQDEAGRIHSLRGARGNALFTDLVGVEALISRSLELAASQTMDDTQKKQWLRRMELLPTPSFDRFGALIPQLGGGLAAVLMHSYGEILRVKAMASGQALTNDNSIDNADFVVQLAHGNLPSLLANLSLAKAELAPYTRFA